MIETVLAAPVFLVAFVFVISIVVVVHELGHYLVARWCGVKSEAFSVGFGPALAKWRDKRGTEWRIAAFPVGGYVKFLGDADASSAPDAAELDALRRRLEAERGPDATRGVYHFQPVWRRALIAGAGPIANFLLAIVIFTLFFSVFGRSVQPPVVGQVAPDTPAAAAGFQPGDRVLSVDGRAIETFDDLFRAVVLSAGETLHMDVERGGEVTQITATPARVTQEDDFGGKMTVGQLGLMSTAEQVTIRYNPAQAVAMGVGQTWEVVAMTGRYVGRIFQGKESGAMLGGPLRMATYSGKVAQLSFATEGNLLQKIRTTLLSLISLAGVLSVGLGMINLLPVPILDGGHLLYYGFEAVSGRPLSERAQAMGFRAGLVLVACLMLFATWNDLNYLRGFFS